MDVQKKSLAAVACCLAGLVGVGRLFAQEKAKVVANAKSAEKTPATAKPQKTAVDALLRQQLARKPGITRVYRLQHSNAGEMANLIGKMILQGIDDESNDYRLSTAADLRTNSLVVQGSQRAHEYVTKLIGELDMPPAAPQGETATEYQVRLVWLVSPAGKNEKLDLTAPPDDLLPVVSELDRLGFGNLTLAGQFISRTRNEAEFGMRGTVDVDRSYTVNLDGRVHPASGTDLNVDLKIQVQGSAATPASMVGSGPKGPEPGPTCQVIATVQTPLSHFVVLGTSPTAQFNSIFVLQMSKAKSIAPLGK